MFAAAALCHVDDRQPVGELVNFAPNCTCDFRLARVDLVGLFELSAAAGSVSMNQAMPVECLTIGIQMRICEK